MKILPIYLPALSLLALGATGQNSSCPDPLQAILATLTCVEEENVTCASAGYSVDFRKLHNGIDTNTTIDQGGTFWSGAFALVDLGLDINYQDNIGPNRASLRFVEIVNTTTGEDFGLEPSNDYPFGQTFLQHEHALVEVDNDCKMTLWDQYGDNAEQEAVDNAVAEILQEPAVQCVFGVQEACSANGEDGTTEPDDATTKPTTSPSSRASNYLPGASLFLLLVTTSGMLVF